MKKERNRKIKTVMGISIGIALGIIAITGIAFVYLSPQFGKRVTAQQKKAYASSGNFRDGKFINPEEIAMELNHKTIPAMFKEMLNPHPDVSPKYDIIVDKVETKNLNEKTDSLTQIIWLGHSSFLIHMDGKTLLLDPVFSQKTGPHSLVGRKKYNSEMPFDIEDIAHVDAVFISHDHYDHLDYESILKLKNKTDYFFVPLGVENHLISWGIDPIHIHKMNWWDETTLGNLKIAFTPSRHMSGRGIADQSSTLWGSWVINGPDRKIYFSGDGGYGTHFKEIGEKYGPFDIGLMECGQYNKLWADVHMMPEESVRAGIDVQAKQIMPIHWGAYRLATHSWTEPVERFIQEAKKLNVPFLTPRIGEKITLNQGYVPTEKWWNEQQYSSLQQTLE